jgi:predicted fused transcriptional regulator/phosphomethylpyrimidine kinase
MRGALKVPAPPEFGVSRHTADVLLAILRAAPDRLAVLNLAPDPALLDAARRAGLRVARVAPEFERAPASLAFGREGVPDVFHHEGAFGIEPQAYFTATGAQALASRVRELMNPG